jgi:hypothetical protein
MNSIKKSALLRAESNPFGSLIAALMSRDIEIKTAIMEFMNCIIVGANMDVRSVIRQHLANIKFDFQCEEALKQIDLELDAVESTGEMDIRMSKSGTQGGISRKLLNLDKLGKTSLIAFQGLRNTSMKCADPEELKRISRIPAVMAGLAGKYLSCFRFLVFIANPFPSLFLRLSCR